MELFLQAQSIRRRWDLIEVYVTTTVNHAAAWLTDKYTFSEAAIVLVHHNAKRQRKADPKVAPLLQIAL